jgi:membrane protease YdiL (CAAX protease family)
METPEQLLRVGIPVVLGIAGAFTLDRLCAVRGFLPPGFRVPWRRIAAGAVLAGLLALGVFAPLGGLGLAQEEPDFSKIATPQLFMLHFLMMGTLGTWFLLGYAGVRPEGTRTSTDVARTDTDGSLEGGLALPPPPPPSLSAQFAAQLGFRAVNVWREVGLGVILGIAAWVAVLLALMGVAGVLWALGGEDAVPQQPPAMVPFIAGLPILVRVLISLSAGVVEETFFRGFLQPRVGIVLSTAFFALAHLSYGQPFMLIGISLLSLIYALLVKWRQNVWPAIAAHVFFDAIQLLVIVPSVLRVIQGTGAKAAAAISAMSGIGAIW